jgi:hypothetical protein
VIDMERASTSNPQRLLTLLALAFAIAAIWAATALGNGGSSSASSDPGSSPPAADFVQSQDDPAPSEDGCPEQDGGSGGSSGTDGTSSSAF